MIDIVLCASGGDEVRLVHDLAGEAAGRARVVRRCADLAETSAVAAAGIGDVVVVDVTVRGFDRDVVAELLGNEVAVVGLVPVDSPVRHTGPTLRHTVAGDVGAGALLEVCERALAGDGAEQSGWLQDAMEPHPADRARMLTVWGPPGAPGRSTLAINLASELAREGTPTVIVDADTHAPSITQMLGVLDETPGLVAACRAAARGTLDEASLEALLPSVHRHLHLLSGIGVPARWPEVRTASLEQVWDQLRRREGLVVADTAPSLEEDEDLSYDTTAPQRNAATISALGRADVVLAVVAAEPVAITRLVRERDRIEQIAPGPLHVAVNRYGGPVDTARIQALIGDRMDVEAIHILPEDTASCRRAAWDGALLAEHAPRSPLRRGLRELAARLAPQLEPAVVGG